MRGRWPFSLVVAVALTSTSLEVAAAGPCRSSATGRACEVGAPPPPLPQYPHPRGLPQIIVGTSLFLFGLPAVFSSLQFLYPDPTEEEIQAGSNRAYNLLIPGVVLIGIGVPLAIVGVVRYERFLRWRRAARVTPVAARTPGGGVAAGLSLRF